MSRFLRAALAVAYLVTAASVSQAQQVTMSGEYGERASVSVPIPLNPPKVKCGIPPVPPATEDTAPTDNARCPQVSKNPTQAPPFGPGVIGFDQPEKGVPVPGAGVIIINGGLNVGDSFTVPTLAFVQLASHKFSPLVNNPSLIQLDTSLTAALPAAQLSRPAEPRSYQACHSFRAGASCLRR